MLLTGCAAAEPFEPVQLSEEEQLVAFEEGLEQQWGWLAERYPAATRERPETRVVRTIESSEWADVMAGCLTRAGIGATSDGSQLQIHESPAISSADLVVAQFACYASYPDRSQLEHLLSIDTRHALYGYYADFVRPCLIGAGQPSPPTPSREQFVEESVFGPVWHPYTDVWQRQMEGALLIHLQQRCPPEPAWADQGAPY